MKEILMATTNQAKVRQIDGVLRNIGISVIGVTDKGLLSEVIEDGQTVIENAKKKALTYAKTLNRIVLSMDNALYFDKLDGDPRQPGLNVRRNIQIQRPADREMVDYYSQLIFELGKTVEARWEYGICVATPSGESDETIFGYKTVFISQPSPTILDGYPLESLQIDSETGKYRSEMSTDQLAQLWREKIGEPLSKFIAGLDY